ncbi:MAG: cupredoxin domain-containing protein [Acidimicrobiales bacterium]|nr:cupredoxin domain-containing protein [Acidimicrobiales bacterium]MCB9373292.1 cupredoxin domain-containing protein [Microthrixaceae bacterium]
MPHRSITRRLVALAAAGLLVLGLAACGSDDDSDSEGASDTTAAESGTDYSGGGSTDTTAADASDTPAESTAPVIQNFAFEPDPISITVGDSVTWTNEDGTTHTVTADDDSFDSGNLSSGDTFEQTFDEAGEFTYHCNIHASMTGTVSVSS